VLVPMFPSPLVTIVLVSIATLGWGFWSCNTLALHADCFPSHLMGTALGLTGTLAALGSAGFTKLAGMQVDKQGYAVPFLAAGLLPLAAFLVLVFGVGRVHMAEEPKTEERNQ
jgi:MFS family permease